jgi:ribosome-associated protein
MARRPAPHRGPEIHYGEGDSPSKTALKAQSHALQVLGRELAELPAERLAALDMPDALREAILAYQRTRTHEGRRRQLQYVGKLMRAADEAPLREAVAEAALGSARETLQLHETERWREALIDDDEALTRWVAEHPDTDAQRLRSLVRAARRDRAAQAAQERQPKSFRELFQFIRPVLAQEIP